MPAAFSTSDLVAVADFYPYWKSVIYCYHQFTYNTNPAYKDFRWFSFVTYVYQSHQAVVIRKASDSSLPGTEELPNNFYSGT